MNEVCIGSVAKSKQTNINSMCLNHSNHERSLKTSLFIYTSKKKEGEEEEEKENRIERIE